MRSKKIVILPTYNERPNLEPLVRMILSHVPDLDILVVDDRSPDGTGAVADSLSQRFDRVSVLHRQGPRGRGLAGIDGFRECLRRNYEIILEMDADFSHSPQQIPDLIEALRSSDIAIGSRQVSGGGTVNRSFFRRSLSLLANRYIRRKLGLNFRDCTSGFRAFRRQALEPVPWERLASAGPSIVEEILYVCERRGCRIVEVPIMFSERTDGESKLSAIKLVEVFFAVSRIRKNHGQ